MKEKRDFTLAQLQAINHFGTDLIISAGAGSGKTATLIERITRKIVQGADISKMLIVTFTKEAANELKTRLISGLADALTFAQTTNDQKASDHLSTQIVKVSSADISTIDSFCYHIVKPNFDKVSLDSDFRIGNTGELNILEKEAMNQVIDSFYEKTPIDKDFLRVVDCYSALSDEESLSDNLIKLYHNISSTADFLESLIQPVLLDCDFMETKYAGILKKTISELTAYYKAIFTNFLNEISLDEKATKKYGNALYSDIDFINRIEAILDTAKYKELSKVFSCFMPANISSASAPNVDATFYKEKRKRFIDQVRKLRDEYFSSSEEDIKSSIEENQKICKAIYKVLTKFHEEYRNKKAQFSLCTFDDISRYALMLLYNENGSITDIAKALRDKYEEIYIDEYQDTNSVQDKIFSAISKNNRFMVGDIKQSIYKFRYAEPEIFSYYRSNFVDKDLECDDKNRGRSIFMSSNFRCNEEIIRFTNLLSNHLFKNTDGIPYNEKDDLEFKKTKGLSPDKEPCEIYLIDTSEKKEDPLSCEGVQAELVAKKIRELLNKGTLANGKPLKKSDIAILLRSTKTKAQPYIDALSRYGIPSTYKADISFYEKPHILLMLCLLNSIDNPYNDIYLAGCMRSDVFKLSLDDLIKIRQNASDIKAPLYQSAKEFNGDKEIKEKISYMTEFLDTCRGEIRKMPAYEAISYVMSKAGILPMCSRDERKDLLKFYNIAREYEKSSFKGLYKFLRYVDGNMDSALREDIGDSDSVKIMTIHASKGLEFEYCFICNLEAEMQKRGATSSLLFDRLLGVAGHISHEGDLAKYNSLIRKCVDLSIKRQAKEEEMRILYVALTRARTKLFLTAELDNIGKRLNDAFNNYPFVSSHSIYASVKRIDFILDAVAQVKEDYFKVLPLQPCDIWDNDVLVTEDSLENDSKRSDMYEKILEKRFNFQYEFDYLNKLPSKLSVSRLHKNMLDLDTNEEVRIDTSLSVLPKFLLNKDKEHLATEIGTATHMFMQFCDFSKLQANGYEAELTRLTENHFISKETASLINGDYIKAFVTSDLFKSMLNAKEIKREFRFNLMMDACDLSSDKELKSKQVLVQGILDCVYETQDNELILVDYKTDKVSDVSELKDRYEFKLSYYKKACEMMFERAVDKVILYSVPLNKSIEI